MEVNLLDLEGLTNEERTIILNVIRRDDEVCRRLETRIKQLKAELHDIRMKSALRTGDDLSKMCARCHMIFGIFVNTGDICPGCHFRVCKNCRENLISHGWMCILCFRENQIRWLTGEWMGKDKTGKSKQIRATDLVRASLRIRHENRSLGGLEDRTGHGSSSSDSSSRHTARVEYPQESDKRRLSSLLESLRSGFGAGTQDGVASATVGSTAGGEMVVQHVSCRRRRDSNSSSDSEPSCQTRETSGARKSRSSGSETLAVGKKASPRHGQGDPESVLTTRVSSASRLAPESPDLEVMSSRREGQARRSADPVLDGGRRHAQSETWAGVEDGRDRKEVRRRVLPQPHLAAAAAVAAAAAADTRPKSGDARSPSHLHDRPEERLLLPAPVTPSGDDDHSSGCSFTSSEWGEVTPTSPSADTPSRRHGHPGLEGHVERRDQSSGDHSSGYLSFPKRSGENSHFPNEHFTKASHNPPRSSSSEITVSESRPHTGEGRLEVPVMQVHVQPAQEDPHGGKLNRSPAEQHVRRHSSGRSDASLASARTASPATKLRLLDLASQRALDRDGDSLASWSGGSEDTLSLGMSCTGLRGSPEVAQSLAAPTGRRPAPKPPGPSQGSKGVRDVEEGTRAGDVEAKVEETSSSSSQTKPIHDGGHRSEVKQNSLSSEKEDAKHSSQVGGDALMINADEAEKEKNQDLRRDYKGSVHAAAAIVDKENAFDDEENLGSSSSSTTVQENISQEEINRNVIINTPYERNVIIDTPVIIDTTYEKKVSDEVDKQPIESELVLDSGLGQEPNLIVEFIEEKSNADEGKEVPCTVTQIVSNTQREIKPLVTGTDGTPSIPEQSDAGYSGQNVTAAAGRVTDTTVPPKPVDQGKKVVPAAGTLPVIITTIAENDSDKGIATGTGRPPFASPKLRLSDVPDGAESQQKLPPDISISRPVDADSAGSEHSSSPEKRSSPHRNSHLSIPSAATGSQSGSHDERSFDDDDDNIDELFANHRSGSRLSAMRNNIGDSRESLASVYSNAGEINYGRIPVTGDIVFGLDYDHRHSVLKIDVRNCQNIAPVDTKHNRSDPYVKVYLLPDKTRSGKRKTKIKKHTLNPVFNEVLTYNISRGELENRTLWVTVWHSDRFGRNDFLGEVLIAMDTYRFDDPSPCAYSLQSRAQESVGEAMQYKGELSLSLMYVTPEKVAAASQKSKSKLKKSKSAAEPMGEIHVMIKSASNLTAVRSNGTSDPFVKGYLLPDRARNGKQKTPVVKNTVNPSWSHILVFDGITPEEIPERSLELTVWDHEKLGTNEFLGGVRLNTGLGVAKGLQVDWMDARGEEAMVWQTIMERHNVWIDARLPLRASMGKPSKK